MFLQLDPAKPGAGVTSEGVLANFFNSLLNKKAGSPGGLNKSGTDSGKLLTKTAVVGAGIGRLQAAAPDSGVIWRVQIVSTHFCTPN